MQVILEQEHRTVDQFIGANIREARELRGWKPKRLKWELKRRNCGRSISTLERIEEGSVAIAARDVIAIGVVLGVSPLVLMLPPAGVVIDAEPDRPLLDDASFLGYPSAAQTEGASGSSEDEENPLEEVLGASLVIGPWLEDFEPAHPADDEGLLAVKAWSLARWHEAPVFLRQPTAEEQEQWGADRAERVLRERLIAQILPALPEPVRRQLAAAKGDWFESEIEDAWNLATKSVGELMAFATRFGVQVTSVQTGIPRGKASTTGARP